MDWWSSPFRRREERATRSERLSDGRGSPYEPGQGSGRAERAAFEGGVSGGPEDRAGWAALGVGRRSAPQREGTPVAGRPAEGTRRATPPPRGTRIGGLKPQRELAVFVRAGRVGMKDTTARRSPS